MKNCLLCNNKFFPKRFWQKFCNNCRRQYPYSPMKEYFKRHRKPIKCLNCQTLFISFQGKKFCLNCNAQIYWMKLHPEKARASQHRYRQSHLELCRQRGRNSQAKINNQKRFGGLKFKVLSRDNYTCQNCGKNISGKNMSCVHHKNENKIDNKMDNLISYCRSCHPSYHYNLYKYQFKKKA